MRRVLLDLAAAVGLVCLLVTLVAVIGGLRPMVVMSGSMAPGLDVGTVVLVRDQPAAAARVGQVVALQRPDRSWVMHRVVRTAVTAGTPLATLWLRGDANAAVDLPVTAAVAAVPVLSVPAVGRLFTTLHEGWMLFWLGTASGVVLAALIGRLPGRLDRPRAV